MKILLVDADMEFLDAVASALRSEGFDIITASDGEQALRLSHDEQPDAVVLEADLPRLSGFGVCEQIRENGPTPVILLSVIDTEEHRVQGYRAGADTCLAKPIDPAELALRIRAVWHGAVGDFGS